MVDRAFSKEEKDFFFSLARNFTLGWLTTSVAGWYGWQQLAKRKLQIRTSFRVVGHLAVPFLASQLTAVVLLRDEATQRRVQEMAQRGEEMVEELRAEREQKRRKAPQDFNSIIKSTNADFVNSLAASSGLDSSGSSVAGGAAFDALPSASGSMLSTSSALRNMASLNAGGAAPALGVVNQHLGSSSLIPSSSMGGGTSSTGEGFYQSDLFYSGAGGASAHDRRYEPASGSSAADVFNSSSSTPPRTTKVDDVDHSHAAGGSYSDPDPAVISCSSTTSSPDGETSTQMYMSSRRSSSVGHQTVPPDNDQWPPVEVGVQFDDATSMPFTSSHSTATAEPKFF
ncbi:unnamed protein product [Amoebophrya sp. A120]|nr:unnamed protein product [Amoebophrya sp. A120]|eukprot:GSA120T00014511001.1